ncbi:MAG: hypothetical protein P1V51_20025 [Deltaproteobacteria bacterium]|nr:hypothetical protein [Deltaproteobacteria bacterium]
MWVLGEPALGDVLLASDMGSGNFAYVIPTSASAGLAGHILKTKLLTTYDEAAEVLSSEVASFEVVAGGESGVAGNAAIGGAGGPQMFNSGQLVPFVIDLDASGGPPRIEVRRISDGYYLDFANNTYKTSGWGQKSVNVPSNGVAWAWLWDTTNLDTTAHAVQVEWLIDGEVFPELYLFNYGGAGATLQQIENSAVLAKEITVLSRLAAANYVAPPSTTQIQSDLTTLLSRLSETRLNRLDFMDAPITSRLAASSYAAPLNNSITAILNALTNVTTGLAAIKTAVEAVPGNVETVLQDDFDGLIAQGYPTPSAIAEEVQTLLSSVLQTAALAGTYLEALTTDDGGIRRFTAAALKKVILVPEELDIVNNPTNPPEVSQMYRVTRSIDVPDPGLGVESINVYRSTDLLSEVWDLVNTIPYTQGEDEVVFDTTVNGFFRIAFVASDGHVGTLSEPFAVGSVYDRDFTYAVESDSGKFIVGDQRYLTVVVTDPEEKGTVCPPSTFSIYGPLSDETDLTSYPETPVQLDVPVLVDRMELKYLLDCRLLEPGLYIFNIKTNTGYEVIQNAKPLKFRVIAR